MFLAANQLEMYMVEARQRTWAELDYRKTKARSFAIKQPHLHFGSGFTDSVWEVREDYTQRRSTGNRELMR